MARKRTFRGSVVVDDFDVLVKELKKLDPQLKKDFSKALNAAATPLRNTARGFVPADVTNGSGVPVFRPNPPTYLTPSWINDTEHRSRDPLRWTWQPGEIKAGIKITRSRKNKAPFGYNKTAYSALAVVNSKPAGAIYELAGAGRRSSKKRTKSVSRNPNAQDDFQEMIVRVAPLNGLKGRMLFKAEAQVGDKVRQEVEKVINERLRKFVRAVNGNR